MKTLITGATGFIGQHLVHGLQNEGHACRCLVRDIEKSKSIFKNQNNIEFVKGDITDIHSLKEIAGNIDIVFHLAACGHVAASTKEAHQNFTKINVTGTENVIKSCLSYPIKKFFHFSSTAALGLIKDIEVTEETTSNPITPYQKSKFQSEELVKKYMNEFNFPAIIFRPCMVYGMGGKGEFLKFTKLIKKGIMPKIGSSKKLTPIINVSDVVQACIKGMEGAKTKEIYLICSERSYPFDEICKEIANALHVTWPKIIIPGFLALLGSYFLQQYNCLRGKEPIVTTHNIKSTIANRLFSIKKANRDFNFSPIINLKKGIQSTVDAYRQSNLI